MDDIKKMKDIVADHEKRISDLEKLLQSHKVQKSTLSSKPTSVYSLIEGLKKDGFFDIPRSLKDIKNELAKNNYHYAVTSLTNPLQRLVRQRVLGRMLQNGMWSYVKR